MSKSLIVGLAAVAAAPLFAQPVAPIAPPPPAAHIAPMADKVMTRAEVDAKVRSHFAKLDTDHDGFITTAEIDAGHAAMSQRWQRGGIGHTLNVKRGDPAAAFDRIDLNKDGAISRDEFAKGHAKRMALKGDGAGHPGMMKMHGRGMGGMMFKMADANKDGRVSLQEATTRALEHFDRVDANRDGRITPDERRQNRDQRRQMRTPKVG